MTQPSIVRKKIMNKLGQSLAIIGVWTATAIMVVFGHVEKDTVTTLLTTAGTVTFLILFFG